MENSQKKSTERLAYLDKIEEKSPLSLLEIETLVKYAIEEPDLSANGYFIKPCIKAIGVKIISQKVLNYYQNGTFIEKVGALKLWYWIREATEKVNIEKTTWTKVENAIKNNKDEYEYRLKNLLPDLKNCTNPIINFYFRWALSPEHFLPYYKDKPETIEELYYSLKEKNDNKNIAILKEICPSINFDALKMFFIFIVKDSFSISKRGILLSKDPSSLSKTIKVQTGDKIKLISPDKSEINTTVKGITFNESQDLLIGDNLSHKKIPFGTEVFLVKEKIILFLDIDGVLITTPSWKKDEILNDGYSKFNPACVQNLNSLLKSQDFEIWISSSRRQTKTERELNQIFKKRGINQEIAGFLPISKKKISRKIEIETFIQEKKNYKFSNFG